MAGVKRGVYRGSLRAIDWCDLDAVTAVARQLGGVVVKHPERENYNIAPCVDHRVEGYAVLWTPEQDNA